MHAGALDRSDLEGFGDGASPRCPVGSGRVGGAWSSSDCWVRWRRRWTARRASPPQQRALLAMLLLSANEVVSRDRIVDEPWGERPPPTATKLVKRYVCALRKGLGHGEPPQGARGERPAPSTSLELRPPSKLGAPVLIWPDSRRRGTRKTRTPPTPKDRRRTRPARCSCSPRG
ncbi:MAG: winged helix-turn-helix domain-containing protein [Solirubrobacteraceae bacterium]